ncbi:hypothetical protein BaRGS_00015809 [Batillaria attramentaria]|uniref:Uncharacterized protein n=1 Tax=Batillaria attramentaria TaxID=370345 RepID=A0ABD0L0C6_9CAEN
MCPQLMRMSSERRKGHSNDRRMRTTSTKALTTHYTPERLCCIQPASCERVSPSLAYHKLLTADHCGLVGAAQCPDTSLSLHTTPHHSARPASLKLPCGVESWDEADKNLRKCQPPYYL